MVVAGIPHGLEYAEEEGDSVVLDVGDIVVAVAVAVAVVVVVVQILLAVLKLQVLKN